MASLTISDNEDEFQTAPSQLGNELRLFNSYEALNTRLQRLALMTTQDLKTEARLKTELLAL